MGTIEKLMTGRDGLTRSALVRTGNGQSTTRPIVKLYPLETATYSSRVDVVRTSAGTKSVTLAGTTRRWRERRTDDDVVKAGCYDWSFSYELYRTNKTV